VAYLITVELRAGRDELDKSRVLEVGEQLAEAFRRSGAAELDITDARRKWNQLLVTVPQTPKLGPVMAEIQKALAKHGLEEIARIKRRRLVGPAPVRREP
jgi:5-carboxymethyl-2-hydroxymuconate isomerase